VIIWLLNLEVMTGGRGARMGGVGLGIKLDTQNPNLNYLDLTLKHLNLKYYDHYFR